MHRVTILPQNITIDAEDGEDLLSVQIRAGLTPDAPCGGQGTCGKCQVVILRADGREEQVLSCRFEVREKLTIRIPRQKEFRILEDGLRRRTVLAPRVKEGYGAAFDIGTTSVVCYLLNLSDGTLAASASMQNPQVQYGADVISRCEYAISHGTTALSQVIRGAMNELMQEACRKAAAASRETGASDFSLMDGACRKSAEKPEQIRLVTVAGNTCMHHLFLGIDPKPLTVAPYEAVVKDAIVMKAADAGLSVHPEAILQILPNIAGFVGADTAACLLAVSFDSLEEQTLLIDIGTNGEMVMGNKNRMIACSTAAGPAFEGAKIACGMRGEDGAIDHVRLEGNTLRCHVLGETGEVLGICGSGLLDAVSCALQAERIDETGRIDLDAEGVFLLPKTGQPAIRLAGDVYLSQQDIREVQLAKGAIAAGIELMAEELGIRLTDISRVLIAGAFGNYMDPHSACVIGMIPAQLEEKIVMIGNAAGEGSMIATLNEGEFLHAQTLSQKAEFLELASSPDFQDIFVEHLLFE